jgi:hypothetical protein
MPLDRPLARPRRLTLGDVIFLVALVSFPLAACGLVFRESEHRKAALFACLALTVHVSVLALITTAGGRSGVERAFGLAGYLVLGLGFLAQFTALVLLDPWNGALVGLSVLLSVFYAVSWC